MCVAPFRCPNVGGGQWQYHHVTDYRFPFDDTKGGTRVAACPDGTDSLMEIVNQCIQELTEQNKFMEWNEQYQEYAKSLGLSF